MTINGKMKPTVNLIIRKQQVSLKWRDIPGTSLKISTKFMNNKAMKEISLFSSLKTLNSKGHVFLEAFVVMPSKGPSMLFLKVEEDRKTGNTTETTPITLTAIRQRMS